jgi:two-component system, NtrC family, nitrogen regulation response regulator GlnG
LLEQAVRIWSLDQFAGPIPPRDLYERFLAQAEPPLFGVVLEKTQQNRSAAADLLGIHRGTLRKRLER